MFHKLEDSYCIYQKNGIYKQECLYERNGYLYVKQGNGYSRLIRLNWDNRLGTTCPNTFVEEIITDKQYEIEPFKNWIKLKE